MRPVLLLAFLLVGCATPTPPAQIEDPDAITVNKTELLQAFKQVFEAGYWEGWKTANQEAGRGL